MSIKKNAGMTLLEVLLVLAIGAAIIVMSIRQYESYRIDVDALEVKANVDAIFQAMGFYYRKNCYGTVDANQALAAGSGTLNPLSQKVTTPFPIDIQKELIDKGFLQKKLVPNNPLVSPTVGTQGYLAQFNEVTAIRQQCDQNNQNCQGNFGTVVTWIAQVSVKLKDPKNASAYFSLLSGDCLSTVNGNIVGACSGTSTTGDIVVWERLPTTSNFGSMSTYWLSTPNVASFKQMYTTESRFKLIENIDVDKQYYTCGN